MPHTGADDYDNTAAPNVHTHPGTICRSNPGPGTLANSSSNDCADDPPANRGANHIATHAVADHKPEPNADSNVATANTSPDPKTDPESGPYSEPHSIADLGADGTAASDGFRAAHHLAPIDGGARRCHCHHPRLWHHIPGTI